MKKWNKRTEASGWSILELIVVCAVIAIIFLFGILYWKNAMVKKQFLRDFDNLVKMFETAPVEARAYGKDPTGFSTSGNVVNGQRREKYLCRLVNRGGNKTDRVDEYSNVMIYTNAAELPMTQNQIKNQFQGVALAFGFKSGPGVDDYTYDFSILYAPDGSMYWRNRPTLPNNELMIEMRSKSDIMIRRVYVNIDNGVIRTQNVKG